MNYFNERTFLNFSLFNSAHANMLAKNKYTPIIENLKRLSNPPLRPGTENAKIGKKSWTQVRIITPIKSTILLQEVLWQRLF